MTTYNQTKTRTTDSTDRAPVLPSTKTGAPSKAPATRFGDAARRLLNALMRSLANPHI